MKSSRTLEEKKKASSLFIIDSSLPGNLTLKRVLLNIPRVGIYRGCLFFVFFNVDSDYDVMELDEV